MSRLDFDRTIECQLPVQQARQIAVDALKQLQWRVIGEQGQVANLEQGSQFKTRLIGGWFCPTSWFPAKATCSARQGEGCIYVDLHFEEAFGFGIVDGMFKKRYEVRFEECFRHVGQSLLHPTYNPFVRN